MKAQNKQGSEQQNVFGSGTPFPSQSCSGGGMPGPRVKGKQQLAGKLRAGHARPLQWVF